jgi:hypothetical protein
MNPATRANAQERAALPQLRELADRMFSRVAGAPITAGNQVRLLGGNSLGGRPRSSSLKPRFSATQEDNE